MPVRTTSVIPAKAGIQFRHPAVIPAKAGIQCKKISIF